MSFTSTLKLCKCTRKQTVFQR